MSAVAPRSLEDLLDVLRRHPDLRPIAGCTDVMVAGLREPEHASGFVDLLRVPELHGIHLENGAVRIGATTSIDELRRHPEIRRRTPCLAQAADRFGGWQVQVRATVGGNIATASPAGDTLPVWLALGAKVAIVGPHGRRELPYDRVHVDYRRTALGPGEIIEAVHVPHHAPGTNFWFRKIGQRQALAISKVVTAAAIHVHAGVVSSARIAAGSVAPTPVRLAAVERFLVGQAPGADVAEEAGRLAAESVAPVDDIRSTAGYRRYALHRAIRRLVLDL